MPSTQTVVVDSENEFDWDQITTVFNDNGVLTSRLTDFDNGNTKQEYFDGVAGLPTVTIEKDLSDVENWEQIFTSYDSGGRATQTTSFDNGVTREDRIEPALGEGAPAYLSSRREYDDGDAFGWESRGSSYDFLGGLTQSFVRYDNGVYDARSFQNGVATSRTKRDLDDVAKWDEIEVTYDQAGKIAERFTQFDNGIFKQESFEDGVRASTYQADNLDMSTGEFAPDGGAKSWQEIEVIYDQGGKIAERFTQYDNGTFKQESFADGVRTGTYQADGLDMSTGEFAPDGGAKNWQEIQTIYDQGGQVAERLTQFDNGILKQDAFENGVRIGTYQADGLDQSTGEFAADGGAKSWQEIQTQYDQNGKIAFKSVVNDNGTVSQTAYEDGVRSIMLSEDVEDAFVWKSIATEYDDAGNVVFKGTEFDNGDQMVAFYVEQALQTVAEVDGDDSEVWGARLTDYSSGVAVVTTYDSADQLPEPYPSLFSDVVATY